MMDTFSFWITLSRTWLYCYRPGKIEASDWIFLVGLYSVFSIGWGDPYWSGVPSFLVCYMKFSRWKRYVNERYDINVKRNILYMLLTDWLCVFDVFCIFAFAFWFWLWFIHCLLFCHGHIFNSVTVCFIVATRASSWQPSTKRYILSYWTRDG